MNWCRDLTFSMVFVQPWSRLIAYITLFHLSERCPQFFSFSKNFLFFSNFAHGMVSVMDKVYLVSSTTAQVVSFSGRPLFFRFWDSGKLQSSGSAGDSAGCQVVDVPDAVVSMSFPIHHRQTAIPWRPQIKDQSK